MRPATLPLIVFLPQPFGELLRLLLSDDVADHLVDTAVVEDIRHDLERPAPVTIL